MNTRNFTLIIQNPELFRSWCVLDKNRKQNFSQLTITLGNPALWELFSKHCKQKCLSKQSVLWSIFEKGLRYDLEKMYTRNPWKIIEYGIRDELTLERSK